MSSILDEFDVFKSVKQELKNEVKIFNVFKPPVNERNGALFVTRDDQVYSVGMNKCGLLGLGSADEVFHSEPNLLEELCDKKISEFYLWNNTLAFFARSKQGHIYAWGSNFSSKGIQGEIVRYLKPRKIEFFDNKKIVKISAFVSNYIALSSDGLLYKFNDDAWADCDHQAILLPILLDESQGITTKIKNIHCSLFYCLALSFEGIVYSCGNSVLDIWNKQGIRQMSLNAEDGTSLQPKKLLTADFIMFILTDQCCVYYSQSLPPLIKLFKIETDLIIMDIYLDDSQLLCQTDDCVYVFQIGKPLIKTNYINFFEYYLGEYRASTGTIHISNDGFLSLQNFEDNLTQISYIYDRPNKFEDKFKKVKLLGEGASAEVYLVDKISDSNKQYAIKKIWIKSKDKNEMFKEFRFMSKISSDFVPKMTTGWIEKALQTFAYIQMEYTPHSLDQLIKNKPGAFGRLPEEPMTAIEFYITCEMFYELIECLDYLNSFEKTYLKQADMLPGRLNVENESQILMHRDIKPQNVLVSNGIDGRFFKLGDYGLMSIYHGLYKSSQVGTLKYLAPEVEEIMDGETVIKYGPEVDIYSIGIIGQELFCTDSTSQDQCSNIGTKFQKITQLIDRMVDQDQNKRPDCSEILELLQEVIDKGEMKKINITEKLSDKFYQQFFITKINQEQKLRSHLSKIDTSSFQDNQIKLRFSDYEEGIEAIDGMDGVIQKLFGLVNSGDVNQGISGIFKEMLGCTMGKIQTSLVEFFEIICMCFTQSNGIITVSDKYILAILENGSNFINGIKMHLQLLNIDKIKIENNSSNDQEELDLMLLKPFIECDNSKGYLGESESFKINKVTKGNSALFDAISHSLFKTTEYSNIIRALTLIKCFEERECFKRYSNLIGENYTLTLLKLATSNEMEVTIKEKFNIKNLSITTEKTAILATQLAIFRTINILTGSSNDYDQYCITEKSDLLGHSRIEDPVWICRIDEMYLSIEPKDKNNVIRPRQIIPDEYQAKLFTKLKPTLFVQPLIDTGISDLFTQLFNYEFKNNSLNANKYTEDDLD